MKPLGQVLSSGIGINAAYPPARALGHTYERFANVSGVFGTRSMMPNSGTSIGIVGWAGLRVGHAQVSSACSWHPI